MRIIIIAFLLISLIMSFTHSEKQNNLEPEIVQNNSIHGSMKLGAFSSSLSVKDLSKSKLFYEHLGFKALAGGFDKKYFIMKNENALIGIFQGMFEGNILTFNPGWDENALETESFDDVRKIQQSLQAHGITLETVVKDGTTGPGSIMVKDPDGNLILIDQHR